MRVASTHKVGDLADNAILQGAPVTQASGTLTII